MAGTWARLVFFLFLLLTAALAVIPFIPGIKGAGIIKLNIDAGYANGVDQAQFAIMTFCLRRTRTDTDLCEVFSPCDFANSTSSLVCGSRQFGYSLTIGAGLPRGPITVSSAWTRTLAVHAAFTASLLLSCLLYVFELFPCTSIPLTSDLRLVVYVLTLVVGIIDVVLAGIFSSHLKSLTGTTNKYTYGQKVTVGPGWAFVAVPWGLIFVLMFVDKTKMGWEIKEPRPQRAMVLQRLQLRSASRSHISDLEGAPEVTNDSTPTLVNPPASPLSPIRSPRSPSPDIHTKLM